MLLASTASVVVRPAAVGALPSAALTALLVVITAGAVLAQARSAAPAGRRPGAEVCVLPAAALVALAVAIAGGTPALLEAVAVLLAGVVCTLVPWLDGLRLGGREGAAVRLPLDVAGIVVMLPVVLLAVADSVSLAVRAAVAAGVAGGVAYDALRVPQPGRRASLAGAGAAALAVAAGTAAARHTAGATALLLLWYGVRGVAVAATGPRRSHAALVEYGAFALAATALLVTAH